jgi:hypothetical protein
MTLQLLHPEFPEICGKFGFLFYQCNTLPTYHQLIAQSAILIILVSFRDDFLRIGLSTFLHDLDIMSVGE